MSIFKIQFLLLVVLFLSQCSQIERQMYFYKVDDLAKVGKFEDALDLAEEGLNKFPKDEKLIRIKAKILITIAVDNFTDGSEASKVLNALIEASKLDPNNSAAYMYMGGCYNLLGKKEKALEYTKKFLEMEPDYSVAYLNVGTLYYNLKKYDEAIPYLRKSIEMDKDQVFKEDAYVILGMALYKTKNYAESKENLVKFLSLVEGNPKLEKDFEHHIQNTKIVLNEMEVSSMQILPHKKKERRPNENP